MATTISTLSINLLIMVSVLAGIIVLQIYLSRRHNKWLGWILPICSFVISIMMVLGVAVFSVGTAAGVVTNILTESGADDDSATVDAYVYPIKTEVHGQSSAINYSAPFLIVIVFFFSNIPTALLLIIYFACRNGLKRNKEIEKMNIQDLE